MKFKKGTRVKVRNWEYEIRECKKEVGLAITDSLMYTMTLTAVSDKCPSPTIRGVWFSNGKVHITYSGLGGDISEDTQSENTVDKAVTVEGGGGGCHEYKRRYPCTKLLRGW